MLWRIWDPEFQRVKAPSEVVFDGERNAHMSCQHGSNEIDMFGLPADEEYVEEIDTGDEPLRGQDSQPTQLGKRSTSHMHEAPDEHQQKTFPSGRNGSVRVDALRQSRQRHPGGGLLRARRQYHASRCTSPSDRCVAVSSRSVGLLF